ncbi:hypothetical protein ASC96_25200 [Rhizobium sp. Root1204]|nr:hypothetical protein ASC96_25200 [Rhizobium sp. Root1204]
MARPFVDLALGFLFFDAVANLNPASQFLAAAIDDIKVVIRQLAPLGLGLAPNSWCLLWLSLVRPGLKMLHSGA